ncbi:MAG: metal-dependent transcriptional regulator [Actinobacteria bacterium]|nr:metal-dependent transcriptional regulator [Actinomycetota bacterium]
METYCRSARSVRREVEGWRAAGEKEEDMGQREPEMLTEKMEEYLEALFKLSTEECDLTPTRLAEYMKVTPPTALDMLRRLEREGYVRYRGPGAGKGRGAGSGRARRVIMLTPKGERAARTLIRRHRLSERFLTDMLGLDWESAHREACRLEHVISPEVEEKLSEMLGNPETCPHGYPIPDENGRMEEEEEEIKPLCDFYPDEKGCIARVEEDEPQLLQYLASLGVMPDADVEVMEVAPFGGPLLVRIGDSQYALGREVASKIWTRKGPARRRGRGKGPGPRRGPAGR